MSYPSLQQSQSDTLTALLLAQKQQQIQPSEDSGSYAAAASSLEDFKRLQAALQIRTGSGLAAGGRFPGQGGMGNFSTSSGLLLAGQQQALLRPSAIYQSRQAGADPFGADRKRAAEEMKDVPESADKLGSPSKRKKKRLGAKGNAFPLPAAKEVKDKDGKAAPVISTTKLQSFAKIWNKLSDGEMRAEIFRIKLHQGKVPLMGKTKSVILQSQRGGK
jgi:hypothetical protein